MKTRIHNSIIVVASILLVFSVHAQEFIEGTISNYTADGGSLVSYDMISKGTIEIGTIDQEGHFKIPLNENYLATIKEKAENTKEPEGWEIEFKTVATTFECSGLYVEYDNGEVQVAGIPELQVTVKDEEWDESVMFAVSNPDIANWLYSYGEKNSAKGYYLQWFFLEEEASAKAECTMPTYTGNDDENYNNVTILNLKLQKGWNIIKYDITEVFTDTNGKIIPSKTEIISIDSLPDDVQWVVVK
ncbi:hypothetical protein [Confluentibacter sediminis]|uniref:hypothetical protein n=1 Tax=Confluentibacter sediminis TaxID=2219045 RepID=UPI000DAF22D1|nr:hypothetical protein [Confluentibacter sediminis]